MPSAECTEAVTGTTIRLTPSPAPIGVRVDRAGAAERDEDEVARVVAPVDRDLANQVGHARVDDPLDALRRVLDRDPERLGDLLADGLARPRSRSSFMPPAEEVVGVDVGRAPRRRR